MEIDWYNGARNWEYEITLELQSLTQNRSQKEGKTEWVKVWRNEEAGVYFLLAYVNIWISVSLT